MHAWADGRGIYDDCQITQLEICIPKRGSPARASFMIASNMNPDEILRQQDHRPFPLPSAPWIMRQTWNDLLFAHWSLPAEALRPLVPNELALDLYDGKAWVAVTPFHMTDVALRGIPAVPVLSAFPELNVRTYVTYQGKPGVFSFSLDAFNPAAV